MTENKRFTIKPQYDLFGVVDNYSPDKVCVINGIRTEIEVKWLCKDMNALNDENKKFKEKIQLLECELNADAKQYKIFIDIINEADDLICSHLSKHYQRKWRAFCKNKEYDFE